jgi:excisionase family DNA binding protein
MKKKTYSDLKYSIRILNNGDGSYSVEVPKIPGCYSAGHSKEECITSIVEAIELHLEGAKHLPPKDPIPSIEVCHRTPSPEEHLLSLPEACKFLDVSDSTLRRYVKSGKIPAYNFGKEYKFKINELNSFIEGTRVPNKLSKTKKAS